MYCTSSITQLKLYYCKYNFYLSTVRVLSTYSTRTVHIVQYLYKTSRLPTVRTVRVHTRIPLRVVYCTRTYCCVTMPAKVKQEAKAAPAPKRRQALRPMRGRNVDAVSSESWPRGASPYATPLPAVPGGLRYLDRRARLREPIRYKEVEARHEESAG